MLWRYSYLRYSKHRLRQALELWNTRLIHFLSIRISKSGSAHVASSEPRPRGGLTSRNVLRSKPLDNLESWQPLFSFLYKYPVFHFPRSIPVQVGSLLKACSLLKLSRPINIIKIGWRASARPHVWCVSVGDYFLCGSTCRSISLQLWILWEKLSEVKKKLTFRRHSLTTQKFTDANVNSTKQ
jgi:hypothetical protein